MSILSKHGGLACLAGLALATVAQGITVNTVYELRAPGGPTTLQVNDTLTLEIWAKVSSAHDPLPGVTGMSFFLSADNQPLTPGQNVISFNVGSYTNSVAGFTPQINPNPTGDNAPASGDMARGLWAVSPGVTFTDGQFRQIGSFSITALNPGTATYTFSTEGGSKRPFNTYVDPLQSGATPTGNSLCLTVTPEPATASLFVLALALAARRRCPS